MYGVASDFQPFGINDLEMVDQIFASWNQIVFWVCLVGRLSQAV
jgi:hypothetical protein